MEYAIEKEKIKGIEGKLLDQTTVHNFCVFSREEGHATLLVVVKKQQVIDRASANIPDRIL